MSTDQTPTYVTFKDRKRHPDLWLDDGNIILATDVSIFRVHRSMLSKNSSVFADMFSMPQPMNSHDEPSVEGLPVVVLTDNDADVTHLLNFVYDRRYYQAGTETPFDKISGLLRMSTKYQIDDLRNEIISHLAVAYPMTLEKYQAAVDPEATMRLLPPFEGQHFAVASLAIETGASVLLPTALWRSTCELARRIEKGVTGQNGTIYQLPLIYRLSCLRVKLNLHLVYMRYEHALPLDLHRTSCWRNTEQATEGFTPCQELAIHSNALLFGRQFVPSELDMMSRMHGFEKWGPLVCATCREFAGSLIDGFQTMVWSGIPELFDLPKWDRVA